MKKLLSIMLSVILILSLCPSVFAQTETEDYSQYPLILVPGYSSTKLYYEDETEMRLWHGKVSMPEFLLIFLRIL